MAKVKVKNRWVKTPVGTQNMRTGTIEYEVARNSTFVTARGRATRGDTFMACARIGSRRPRSEMQKIAARECAFSTNPRKALAKALAELTRTINSRRGAFRGVVK